MGWGRFLFLTFICLIVAIGLSIPVIAAAVPVWIHFRGTPVTAVVESRTYGTGKNASKRYIHYRYPWNGTSEPDREQISLDSYKKVRIGQKLSAKVAGWRGWSESLLTEPGYQSDVWDGAIGVGIVAPILGMFAVMIWLKFYRQKRLVRIGTAVPGTVTDKRIRNYKSTQYFVDYNYKSTDGKSWDASLLVDSKAYERTAIGSAVTVLHDLGSDRPQHGVRADRI